MRGKDDGLSPLPPDRALRASVGAAWQGGGLLSLSPHPQRDKDGPPSFGRSNATPALCLPAGALPEPDVRAAVAGSGQADDSDAGRREESPRVSWAPAPLTVLSVGCDFWGGLCAWGLCNTVPAARQFVCLGLGFFPLPSRALLSLVSGTEDKWSI